MPVSFCLPLLMYIAWPDSQAYILLSFFGAFFCLSATVFLGLKAIVNPSTKRPLLRYFLLPAIGLFAIQPIDRTVRSGKPFFGLPEDELAAVTGRLSEQSQTQEGRTRIALCLESIETKNGSKASASGFLRVYCQFSQSLPRQIRVRLEGKYAQSETGPPFVLVKKPQHLKTLSPPPFLWAAVHEFKYRLSDWISGLGYPAAGFFEALFLGVKDGLYFNEAELFRQAGIVHVLALSGMHLSILTGALFFILRPLLGKRRAFLLTLPFIAFYLLLTWPKISLFRAALMYLLFGSTKIIGRPTGNLAVLAHGFYLSAWLQPLEIFSLAFQLSFLALLGLLSLGPFFSRRLGKIMPDGLAAALGFSVAAQIATAPLILYKFGYLIPGGVLAALLVTPVVILFFWVCLILLPVFAFFSFLSHSALSLLPDYIYRVIIFLVERFARLPKLTLEQLIDLPITPILIAALTGGLVWKKWKKSLRSTS